MSVELYQCPSRMMEETYAWEWGGVPVGQLLSASLSAALARRGAVGPTSRGGGVLAAVPRTP